MNNVLKHMQFFLEFAETKRFLSVDPLPVESIDPKFQCFSLILLAKRISKQSGFCPVGSRVKVSTVV